MTSSDLEEIVGVADVVITLYRGRAVARATNARGSEGDITHPLQASA